MMRTDELRREPPMDWISVAARARLAQSATVREAIDRAGKGLWACMIHAVARDKGHGDPEDQAGTDGSWIAPKRPLVLPARVRQTISCDSGTVWITQGDGNDYVLTAGEKLTLAPADDVIVSAMANPAFIRRCLQQSPRPLASVTATVKHDLTQRERELVALGAAMGSNCEPCIAAHVPAARKAGLTKAQVAEALRIAVEVRGVPA